MDLFNTKTLAEMAKVLNESQRENGRLQGDLGICRLIIRDMDKMIFQMGQQTSWNAMQPIFAQLLKGTEHRMKVESERINSIVQHELNRTAI